MDKPPYADMSRVITNVRHLGQECEELSSDEIKKRFPGLDLAPDECASFEPASGFIRADLALKALQVKGRTILSGSEIALYWSPMRLQKFHSPVGVCLKKLISDPVFS